MWDKTLGINVGIFWFSSLERKTVYRNKKHKDGEEPNNSYHGVRGARNVLFYK